MKSELNLTMIVNTNRNEAITKYDTTIDAILSRFLIKIESHILMGYFTYHKPIV